MNFFDHPIRGVDLSTYDGAVNWDILNTKIQFAIPRIGYGRTMDSQFKANWAGCKVVKQAYWYLDYYSNYNADSLSYGMSNAEWGRTQAQNAYNFVGEKVMTWLDIESAGASYSPAISTVWTRVQEIARAFLEKIDELNGMTNGIYCSLSLTKEFGAWFRSRPLWVAWYTRLKSPEQVKAACASNGWTGRVWYWQYASDGDTDADGDGDGKSLGLTRNVGDLDIWLGTADEWNKPDKPEVKMILDVPQYSQQDELWRKKYLGNSTTTIGNYGCLLTCAAMLCKFYGKDTDPARLNAEMIAHNGYSAPANNPSQKNLWGWSTLSVIYPDIVIDWANYINCELVPAPLEKIDAVLQAGYPVIVKVDYNPATLPVNEHWVLVIGKEGASYIINDPIDGARVKFESRYGAPARYIFRIAVYKGTAGVPALTLEQRVSKLEAWVEAHG